MRANNHYVIVPSDLTVVRWKGGFALREFCLYLASRSNWICCCLWEFLVGAVFNCTPNLYCWCKKNLLEFH